MRKDTISAKELMIRAKDDEVWIPIPEEEHGDFQYLIDEVRNSLEKGTKKEKGDALEHLMTYVYERFDIAIVDENVHHGDNQIDHIIHFIDGLAPSFVYHNIGDRMVGESKNHKESISVRDVTDLVELLRSKKSKVGIFSSTKSFSRGRNKSPWVNAEGKRRKLAIANDNNRIILGFTIDELETLKSNNFYTMLKNKYYSLIDEIEDDITDYATSDLTVSYPQNLFYSLAQLWQSGIIDKEAFEKGRSIIESRYGSVET